jgi:hypothetical protein
MEELFKSLSSVRGSKRTEVIEQCARRFYLFLKNNQYNRFSRELLISKFSNEVPERTRNKHIKEILSVLTLESKIRVVTSEKEGFGFFRVKSLFCQDSGSYSIMMEKNGFKVAYYRFESVLGSNLPVRKKVGVSAVNCVPEGLEFDESALFSSKGVSHQKVVSSSPLSIAKCHNRYAVKVFEVC